MKHAIQDFFPSALKKQLSIVRASTYCGDGLITAHNSDFLHDPLFVESYRLGKATGSWGASELEWRAYIACWAAERGKSLGGDFVECGVNRGGLARTVMNYVGFKALRNRNFYLLDTFSGIPEENASLAAEPHINGYSDCYSSVLETFREFDNVVIIRGRIPETLPSVRSQRVCYLSIDMNCAEPEIAAAEYFWDRLVSGAVILLDDYGYSNAYRRQREAFDDFTASRNARVLLLPTGQGMIFKP